MPAAPQIIGCGKPSRVSLDRGGRVESAETYTGLIVDALATFSNELAVRLHVALLEVVREFVHVLVVREQRVRLGAYKHTQGSAAREERECQSARTVEVVVPDPDDGEEHGVVFLERGGAGVGVHIVRATKESLKVLVPDHKRDREANCAPEAVAAASPVPEAEHVLLRDAERGDSLLIRAERDEVLRDISGGAGAADGIEEPSTGTLSIRDGLLGSEGLAGDDEEGTLGVARAEGLREVGAVDV